MAQEKKISPQQEILNLLKNAKNSTVGTNHLELLENIKQILSADLFLDLDDKDEKNERYIIEMEKICKTINANAIWSVLEEQALGLRAFNFYRRNKKLTISDIAQALIQPTPKPSKNLRQALIVACQEGKLSTVKSLLQELATAEAKTIATVIKETTDGTEKESNLLLIACLNNHYHVAKSLIEFLKDDTKTVVNSVNNEGWTPLHAASFNSNVLLVVLLLLHGAKESINLATDKINGKMDICTAQELNERTSRFAEVKQQIEWILNNWRSPSSLLLLLSKPIIHKSVDSSIQLSLLRILLKFPEFSQEVINTLGDDGYSALHNFCVDGHSEAAKLLLSRGADPNKRQSGNSNILIKLSYQPHKAFPREIVSLLLEHDAVDDSLNSSGQSMIHLASAYCESEILLKLLQKNPENINLPDKDGMTPLYIAGKEKTQNRDQTVLVLLKYGAAKSLNFVPDGQSITFAFLTFNNYGQGYALNSETLQQCIEHGLIIAQYKMIDNPNQQLPYVEAGKSKLPVQSTHILNLLGQNIISNEATHDRFSALPTFLRTISYKKRNDQNYPNLAQTTDISPILTACYYGHDQGVNHLLTHSGPEILLDKDSNGWTVFHATVASPLSDKIREILYLLTKSLEYDTLALTFSVGTARELENLLSNNNNPHKPSWTEVKRIIYSAFEQAIRQLAVSQPDSFVSQLSLGETADLCYSSDNDEIAQGLPEHLVKNIPNTSLYSTPKYGLHYRVIKHNIVLAISSNRADRVLPLLNEAQVFNRFPQLAQHFLSEAVAKIDHRNKAIQELLSYITDTALLQEKSSLLFNDSSQKTFLNLQQLLMQRVALCGPCQASIDVNLSSQLYPMGYALYERELWIENNPGIPALAETEGNLLALTLYYGRLDQVQQLCAALPGHYLTDLFMKLSSNTTLWPLLGNDKMKEPVLASTAFWRMHRDLAELPPKLQENKLAVHCQFILSLQSAMKQQKDLQSVISMLIATESGNFLTSIYQQQSRYGQIAKSLNTLGVMSRLGEYLKFIASDAATNSATAQFSRLLAQQLNMPLAGIQDGQEQQLQLSSQASKSPSSPS